LSSNIRNDLLENHGSSGLIEVNRLAVDQRYRKTGLPEDLFLMFKTYCENNILEQRPLINLILTKTIDIPLKIYPQWMTQTMKEVGKPFYYEKTDPYPCQIYIFKEIQGSLKEINKILSERKTSCK
jgi:hypothetical protein